jgi:hypothetical protein
MSRLALSLNYGTVARKTTHRPLASMTGKYATVFNKIIHIPRKKTIGKTKTYVGGQY